MNTPAPQVEMVSDVPGLLEMSDLLRRVGVETKSFHDQEVAEAAYRAGYQAALNARAGGDGGDGELVQLLVELREYMHDRADADHDGEKFVGNVERGLGERIDAALASQAVGVKDGR